MTSPIIHLVFPPTPLPPRQEKNLHCLRFSFVLGIAIASREIDGNTYAKFCRDGGGGGGEQGV